MATPPTICLGIDPGIGGGLAGLDEGCVELVSMPETDRDIWEWLRDWGTRPMRAVIEAVHAMPKQGVSSTFKFGVSYGKLLMALTAACIPFEEVSPQRWQKALGVPKRGPGETKVSFKNRLKQKAQQLFPEQKVTLATADALLLAEYCRRMHSRS